MSPQYQVTVPEPGVEGFAPGSYLAERRNVAEMMLLHHEVRVAPYAATDAGGRDGEWLFVRPGGFGDILFLTPTLREIKRRQPGGIVRVACLPLHGPVLAHNPDVDEILPYPLPVEEWERAGHRVWLEGIIERNPEAERVHAVDLIAGAAGIASLEDRRLRYVVTREEREWACDTYPRHATRRPRLGVQVHASGHTRTYPAPKLDAVLKELHRRGWEIVIFAAPDRWNGKADGVRDLSKDGLTFRQACAVLSTCDVVLAPDSALCHVAGALDVPTVALYGPFPWKLRTAYAPSIHALTGQAPCAPCFHHADYRKPWPAGKPCNELGWCVAMDAIEPRRVVAKIEAVAKQQP